MPIAFWSVFAAFCLVYLAKVPVGIAQNALGRYDNRNPREQQARLEGWGKRAHAAHLNSFEGFAPFAAAVALNHLAGGDAALAGKLGVAYVISRVIYIGLYIADVHLVRSVVWAAGMGCIVGLFVSPALN
jgi:uncharacterized MAPEG superfamily protein